MGITLTGGFEIYEGSLGLPTIQQFARAGNLLFNKPALFPCQTLPFRHRLQLEQRALLGKLLKRLGRPLLGLLVIPIHGIFNAGSKAFQFLTAAFLLSTSRGQCH